VLLVDTTTVRIPLRGPVPDPADELRAVGVAHRLRTSDGGPYRARGLQQRSLVRRLELPGGERVPVLGQGTYRMGEDRACRRREVAALRTGLELGMTVIDTAEMYADGGAERVVGEAIRGRRDDVFLITKVYPWNATRAGMAKACELSLRRLGTDRVDLYLLHWRGDVPLRETLAGFDDLLRAQKIRYAGVSNFDVGDLEELGRRKDGLRDIAANEVMYNLEKRGIEYDLIGWCRRRKRTVIAYSPIEEGLLTTRNHVALGAVAERHAATPSQVALAWVIREPGVIAIPKAARAAHARENAGAAALRLTRRDLDELDASFAPPEQKLPLATR
jgi:diketogulonate reductase-like aldo/keto reductase